MVKKQHQNSDIMEKNMANVKSIFKRTLSFTKSSSKGNSNTLEVPSPSSGTPWARATSTSGPQIRVTEPTPVDEPLFPIEDLFDRRSRSEV